jgi:hypothetical protein
MVHSPNVSILPLLGSIFVAAAMTLNIIGTWMGNIEVPANHVGSAY